MGVSDKEPQRDFVQRRLSGADLGEDVDAGAARSGRRISEPSQLVIRHAPAPLPMIENVTIGPIAAVFSSRRNTSCAPFGKSAIHIAARRSPGAGVRADPSVAEAFAAVARWYPEGRCLLLRVRERFQARFDR